MKHPILMLAGASLALLSGCLSSTTSSAEATTPTQSDATVVIEGIAATGYALAQATVTITDADGDVVYTGETNDSGKYKAEVKVEGLSEPIQVMARKGDIELEALLEQIAERKQIRAHVNAVTNIVAKEIRRERQAQFIEDLKDADPEELRIAMQERAKELLGENADYEDFSAKEDFVAAITNRPEVKPCLEDMILHAMGEKAQEEGKTIEEWTREKVQEKAALMQQTRDDIATDEGRDEFKIRVMVLAERYGVDPVEMRAQLGESLEAAKAKYQGTLDSMDFCVKQAVAPIVEELIRLEVQLQQNPENALMQQHQAQVEARLQEVQDTVMKMCAEVKQGTREQVEPQQPGNEAGSGINANAGTGEQLKEPELLL